jgi:hypothetical protein
MMPKLTVVCKAISIKNNLKNISYCLQYI